MGRTGVSKKLKYFWKKILILTWMFSLFLGILAGPCAVDAKIQKEKKEKGEQRCIHGSSFIYCTGSCTYPVYK